MLDAPDSAGNEADLANIRHETHQRSVILWGSTAQSPSSSSRSGRTGVRHDGVEPRTPLLQCPKRPVSGPQRRVRAPAVHLVLEDLLVVMGDPLSEFALVFDLDQVHAVLLVDLGQGQGVRGGEGSAALIQSTKGCLYRRIRAARLSMVVAPRSSWARQRCARSCRAGMVLVDQPTEDLAARDRLGPRWPRAGDRAADIVRAMKTEPAMRSMRVVVRRIA